MDVSPKKCDAVALPRIESVTAVDGVHLFARVWEAPNPVARVFCLHGIISHGGWYSESCRRLAQAAVAR